MFFSSFHFFLFLSSSHSLFLSHPLASIPLPCHSLSPSLSLSLSLYLSLSLSLSLYLSIYLSIHPVIKLISSFSNMTKARSIQHTCKHITLLHTHTHTHTHRHTHTHTHTHKHISSC